MKEETSGMMVTVPEVSFPPAAYIIGVPRSGTTLLRMMLDSHPQVAIPPESHFYFELLKRDEQQALTRAEFFDFVTSFFTWDDFGIEREELWSALETVEPFTLSGGVRAFYGTYAARFRKERWGEKTPDYGNIVEQIEALLPEAHFIHIIRDGRDVALSRRHLWFGPGESILAQAEDWTRWIMRVRAAGQRCRHYLEIHYERLLEEPRAVLQVVCNFLQLPFREEMLTYHETAQQRLDALQGWGAQELSGEKLRSVHELTMEPPRTDRAGRWKRELPAPEVRLFEEIAGPVLHSLGYEVGAAGEERETARPLRHKSGAVSVSALLLTDGLVDEALPRFARLREQVDEFVVWIASANAPAETEERVRQLGARIHYFRSDGFCEPHMLPAIESCRTDWVLRLDSDEELGPQWSDPNWRDLLNSGFTSFALPRRWIIPSGEYLSRAPWWPDFQVRLFRNSPGKLRFDQTVHCTLEVEGQRGFCRSLALHHHVLRMLPREKREEKVRFYRTLSGPDFGHYYLWEDQPGSAAPLPLPVPVDPERELVRMGMLFPHEVGEITLETRAIPSAVTAGEVFSIRPNVANNSTRELVSVPPFPVNLAYHWLNHTTSAMEIQDGRRTTLFPPIAPGAEFTAEMMIEAPTAPGDYVLHVTAVQEGVQWFEEAVPAFGSKAVVRVE